MVQIAGSKGLANEFVVAVCELEWGPRLPKAYRRFLFMHNGAIRSRVRST